MTYLQVDTLLLLYWVKCKLKIVKCLIENICQKSKVRVNTTFPELQSFWYLSILYYNWVGKKCAFQHHYLKLYKWLGYSVKLEAYLCFPCSLLENDRNVLNFVHRPVSNWTRFNNKVRAHSKCSTHIRCVAVITSFMETHSCAQPRIVTSLNKHRQEL